MFMKYINRYKLLRHNYKPIFELATNPLFNSSFVFNQECIFITQFKWTRPTTLVEITLVHISVFPHPILLMHVDAQTAWECVKTCVFVSIDLPVFLKKADILVLSSNSMLLYNWLIFYFVCDKILPSLRKFCKSVTFICPLANMMRVCSFISKNKYLFVP